MTSSQASEVTTPTQSHYPLECIVNIGMVLHWQQNIHLDQLQLIYIIITTFFMHTIRCIENITQKLVTVIVGYR